MSIDLGRLLIEAGVLPAAEVEAALFLSVVRGIPFARALVDRGAITEQALEAELDRRAGLALRQVIGSRELFARLPKAMCRRLGAVPTRVDTTTGAADVATSDPLDRHVGAEFGFHLGMPVRLVRAPMAAIEEAIRTLELDERQAPSTRLRPRRVTPPSPHGSPQSTIPPPPSEELPIPLVRRAPHVYPGQAPAAGVTSPRAQGQERSETRLVAPSTLRGPGRTEADDGELGPAISFPSTPPGAAAEDAPVHEPSGDRAPVTLPQGRLHVPRLEPLSDGALQARFSAHDDTILPPASSGPFADLDQILAAIDGARSRDEIVALALEGLRHVAARAALFAVKRGMFQGYTCTPTFGDEVAFREVAIAMSSPSLLATANATGTYLGPIPGNPVHAPLLAVMGSASPDVAAVAVRVAGRPVLVLVADELSHSMTGTRSMDELARAVGDALTRILAARL
ncbi:hypothetical protein [Chondromyces crocatus]|uniref:GspE/PulE/PilB domain-containing protein n=1 Tax=Chondromyces crocatus TaxID=52 RepID=UPI00146FCCDB|nr:hypothetical protein [Chondromyces crocatus]